MQVSKMLSNCSSGTTQSPGIRRLAAAVLALSPVGALAQGGAVTLGPVSATSVPTMTPAMLVALSVMLVIVALRVMRSPAANRTLSVLLLGSATLIAGLGVERTIATGAVSIAETTCESTNIELGYFRSLTDSENAVDNQCGRDLEIKSYNFTCGPGESFDDNGSPVGTLVPADEITPLGYCAALLL